MDHEKKDLSQFDDLIKNKLQEDIDLHDSQIENSKPFVWTAIQNNGNDRKSLTWYHLAAAVILLMILFTGVLFNLQNNHKYELIEMSSRIQTLQDYYSSQEEVLADKDSRIRNLSHQVDELKIQMNELPKTSNSVKTLEVERVVYQTDTVYISEIKYVTSTPTEEVKSDTEIASIPGQLAIENESKIERETKIFPNLSNQNSDQSSRTPQVKFGAFASNKTN